MKVAHYILLFVLLLGGQMAYSQHHHEHGEHDAHDHHEHEMHDDTPLHFRENKGQWEDIVQFKAAIPGGQLFLEKNQLTYAFLKDEDLVRMHALHHHEIPNPTPEDYLINGHTIKVDMVGANPEPSIRAKFPREGIFNYFVGDDPSKWASDVQEYAELYYEGIYPATDLRFYGKDYSMKYDFIVHPGGDPDKIQLQYGGHTRLYLRSGALHVHTSVNKIVEQKPFAFQMIDGVQVEVPCKFKLVDGKVTFDFPRGYNPAHVLVIDPQLIFSTYSGSQADNWGYTATYDDTGHLYAGGIASPTTALPYPTTTGAFQTSFGGGDPGGSTGSLLQIGVDIVLIKYTPDGSSRIYSTFLGGARNECPHSLVVNSNNELLVLGTTSSNNFPTSTIAYDKTFNGGTSVTADLIVYNQGSDLVISRISPNGNSLLSSTYVGGTGNDGLNMSTLLHYNYGDAFRGEIIADDNNDVYVATTTSSNFFPTTGGAMQQLYGGGAQDGIAFKLNQNLTTLIWSTYVGGTGDDAAYGVQFDNNFDTYIAGGTSSTNFPVSNNALNSNPPGGINGFVMHLNSNATNYVASTYLGTGQYDQAYFVQLDFNNNVYVVGQTEGSYQVTPTTVYNNPNSGQFLHKLDNNLSSTIFSTVFGRGTGDIDITLSAFLVNECDHIYVSGWGGVVNAALPNSSTTGLPITNNAIQSTTDGSDFYLIVLAENADSLLYSTFFGGGMLPGNVPSREHVDGGTSRFDKRGVVYQAVCAGCGGNNAFPTTPGVWSTTNGSANCNIGAFKLDLSVLKAHAGSNAPPFICVPDTVKFINTSNGGTDFFWDFGDNTTSTAYSPEHVFTTPGTYTVMLVAKDSLSCHKSDTDYVSIVAIAPPEAQTNPVNAICPGDSVQLNATGGQTYSWSPAHGLSDPTIPNPWASPDSTITYVVSVTDTCGTDTAHLTVTVFEDGTSIIPDTSICIGQSATIWASGGLTYNWSPISTSIPNPTVNPTVTTTYTVTITDHNNCVWTKDMTLTIDTTVAVADAGNDTTICLGFPAQLQASGGFQYNWSPPFTLSNSSISNPIASPTITTIYNVTVTNGCGPDTDDMVVFVRDFQVPQPDDVEACINDSVQLFVPGGVYYTWSPSSMLSNPNVKNPIAYITAPTTFTVIVEDSLLCADTLSFFVDTLPRPFLEAGEDQLIEWGSTYEIFPAGQGDFLWSPPERISCLECPRPVVGPLESTTYHVTLTDSNGCTSVDSIRIWVTGTFYAPNSFTPNGDGVNDIFFVYGKEIYNFNLRIFDRWGEMIYTSTDRYEGWDGTHKGKQAQIDTYVWRVDFQTIKGEEKRIYGHVTLVR